MSQQGSHDPTHSQISSTGRIDQMCDQFEKACQAGKPPLIEEVLLQAPPGERDRLLGELLEIELDFRQRGGAFLQLEEYRGRFPESADLVESVFRRVVKTRRLGDYELLEELGRGGMGVVYKARQIYLNQTVALKILPHRYLDDPQAVSRFRREMQSIGGLNHPNIVRAYNAGEAGGVHFLVMEFVDGVNLQQFVGAGMPPGGPLGVGAACEIIRQAALGLQHAHEHQLVHRDVKPANLMLCRSGQVKLLDLGLAKFHAERRRRWSASRSRRPDAAGRHHGHDRLHGARTVGELRRGRHPRGHLQPRLHALLPAHGQASLRRPGLRHRPQEAHGPRRGPDPFAGGSLPRLSRKTWKKFTRR